MSSCWTRRQEHMKTCLRVEQEDMSSCWTRQFVLNKKTCFLVKTCLLVPQGDMFSWPTRTPDVGLFRNTLFSFKKKTLFLFEKRTLFLFKDTTLSLFENKTLMQTWPNFGLIRTPCIRGAGWVWKLGLLFKGRAYFAQTFDRCFLICIDLHQFT